MLQREVQSNQTLRKIKQFTIFSMKKAKYKPHMNRNKNILAYSSYCPTYECICLIGIERSTMTI